MRPESRPPARTAHYPCTENMGPSPTRSGPKRGGAARAHGELPVIQRQQPLHKAAAVAAAAPQRRVAQGTERRVVVPRLYPPTRAVSAYSIYSTTAG